jgi:alkylglycerol monooxygenase
MNDTIILYALPVFLLLIVAEWSYGMVTGNNTYRINDCISSLSQGLLSQAVAVCT